MGIPNSTVKVNKQEELRDGFEIGSLKPDSEATIIRTIMLDGDDEPDSLEITFKEPSEEVDDEEESVKDWKVMEFYKNE